MSKGGVDIDDPLSRHLLQLFAVREVLEDLGVLEGGVDDFVLMLSHCFHVLVPLNVHFCCSHLLIFAHILLIGLGLHWFCNRIQWS